jgi:hypothetical protein
MYYSIQKTRHFLLRHLAFLALMLMGYSAVAQAGKEEKTKELPARSIELPAYFMEYAMGGEFRTMDSLPEYVIENASKIIPIPVLMAQGMTVEQAYTIWSDAVKANVPNKAEVSSAPKTLNAISLVAESKNQFNPNIELPKWIFNTAYNTTELTKLFNVQLRAGNVLIVDPITYFPLKIAEGKFPDTEVMSKDSIEIKLQEFKRNNSNVPDASARFDALLESLSPRTEVKKYFDAIVWWSAAYPDYFYNLANPTLQYTLMEKDLSLLSQYGNKRYMLTPHAYKFIKPFVALQ